ncbi:hypothetical protein HYC85_002942 [Camellia sinensis]|uniref:RNA ligase/cyclic nucleotide phosphodiesterase n=1 Tax=Camellia sinensis TaxID=4442 RepID=A0A7J7I9Q1_CAMSI|nr:hypothetical protein HYC85_002942 [Camellia sinensis]
MSQGYAIELYFDPALENQVLKAWNVLARRQISTQLIEIESRPHITLFSSPFIDPSKLENIAKSLASKQEPLAISFSSIGSLPNDNNVLFLAPTPSLPLLQFHLQLCDAMKKEGIEIGEEYRPDSWIPYCPVAEEVPKSRMAEAFTVLRDLKLPGYWVRDGYWAGGVFSETKHRSVSMKKIRKFCLCLSDVFWEDWKDLFIRSTSGFSSSCFGHDKVGGNHSCTLK